MGKTTLSVSNAEDDNGADSNIEAAVNAAVNAALAQKEDMFENLLQMQQSTFQACLQSFVDLGGYEFGLEIESVLGKFEKTIYNDI